jgi:hypothetical protein
MLNARLGARAKVLAHAMTMQLAVLALLAILVARLPVWIPLTIAILGFALLMGVFP